jgi:replicative DNA helicase Mcm
MLADAGVVDSDGKVDMGVLQGKSKSEISRMQLFMDILKALEGDAGDAVEEKRFIDELVRSNKFTEEDARKYIRKMLQEATIYESKVGHYRRT